MASTIHETEYDVFLFANPRSGGNKAKKYIKMDFDYCHMSLEDGSLARLAIYNVIDPDALKRGVKKLRKTQR